MEKDLLLSIRQIAAIVIALTTIAARPPEPVRSADIYLSGPAPCTTMWMQVLKRDAENCRVGGAIDARGVVTSDAENHAWQIGPVQNEYMTLGQDFTCS